MRALLDINILIALLDADHLHHGTARRWLINNIEQGWASCPLTQNGCIRILSQPVYPGSLPPARVADRLRAATETEWHTFWPDSISLLGSDQVDWASILGSRQITDAYLLALATRHGGRLVTLDRKIQISSVPEASQENLVVI